MGSFLLAAFFAAPGAVITIDTSMAPPEWALLEREVLRQSARACEEFYARYFDERGYLLCVPRWGGDDGPDDAIENVNDWPLLHSLGAPDSVLALYKKAWEGHLRQFTEAKTIDVPFARDGMYFKEFPVSFDWLHNGEGLTAFNLAGLSDPIEDRFQARVRRYAGFYMNEDPLAPNYDPAKKIIRSLFNGSRGPLLRKATALDWAGDPIEIEGRFKLGHGERSYEEMLAHFKDYTDIVGDHPQNLAATTLALNAYMLAGEEKYKRWLLEYVDAWVERTVQNGGIIPTNIGLDGTIGGATGGKWYGGVYGWGFSVVVPQSGEMAHRNHHELGLTGFGNAYLLTGDRRYLEVWRGMIEKVNAEKKVEGGRELFPRMHGDQGWYHHTPEPYSQGALEIWYWSMDREDLKRLPRTGWIAFLEGKNPDYPVESLRAELASVRVKVQGMRRDPTTPDTRLSDDPMKFNPADARGLVELTLGGFHPGHKGAPLHARLRYFDPLRRRAGLPEDVAALVDSLTGAEATVTLVNLSQIDARTVIVQSGAYGEHQVVAVTRTGRREPIGAPHLTVRLEPGAGARLIIETKRYANRPTLSFPWSRT